MPHPTALLALTHPPCAACPCPAQPWPPLAPEQHISLSTAPSPRCSPSAQFTALPTPNTTHHTTTHPEHVSCHPHSSSHHFPTSWPFFPQLPHLTPHCTPESFRRGRGAVFLPMKALQSQQDPVLGAPSKRHTQQRTPHMLLGNTQISLPAEQVLFGRVLPFLVE